MRHWYFAYGSNLWIDQMVERVGPVLQGEDRPRRAHLPNHRLTFNVEDRGEVFANVVSPGAGVFGVLYCCTSDALKRLDEFEAGYERRIVCVFAENGDAQNAFIYIAGPAGLVEGGAPSAEYLTRITTGARQHGLPETYVREIEAIATATSRR
jgi:gamma-glutamylcyclotransferase